MTEVMTHLPRYVPAQIAAARAAAERRARMVPTPRALLVHTDAPPAPVGTLHLRPGERSGPPKVHEVQLVVCNYLGTRLVDMVGKSHKAVDVRPRQLAMYLTVELTGQSDSEISRRFGGRDHTTLRHGCRQVESAIRNDPLYARAVRELREMLK